MSLFANYRKERLGKDTLESPIGFATFEFADDVVYIEDIYVIPEHRKSGEASRLADRICDIARDRGCKRVMGSVAPQANGATESCKVLLAYGFKIFKSTPDLVYFVKEL